MFWQPGLDITTGGLSIPLASAGGVARTRVQLTAVFGISLSDELALHMFYMSKGSLGLKSCTFGSNGFDAKTSRSSVKRSPWARLHTCHVFSEFVLHTPGTIAAIVSKLREASTTYGAGQFKELQTSYGFTFEPESILFDDVLRPKVCPSTHAIYDYMHVLFVTGVFNHCLGRIMHALRKTNFTYHATHQFLQQWTWPHATKIASGIESCSESRAKTNFDGAPPQVHGF